MILLLILAALVVIAFLVWRGSAATQAARHERRQRKADKVTGGLDRYNRFLDRFDPTKRSR